MANWSFLALVLCFFDLAFAEPLDGVTFVKAVQSSMAQIVKEYVERETMLERWKLEQLKKHAETLEEQSNRDPPNNPVAIYLIAEKLMEEWNGLNKTMKSGGLSSTDFHNQNLTLPKQEDLKNIAYAIFRVQDVYRFDPIHIASGLLPHLLSNGTLSARTCHNLGLIAFEAEDDYHALMWFQTALYRLNKEAVPTVAIVDLYPLLAMSMHYQNNAQRAWQLTQLFLEAADEEKVQQIMRKYPEFRQLVEEAKEHEWTDEKDLPQLVNDGQHFRQNPKYDMMCRQEITRQNQIPSTLTCYYDHTSPYLMMAPAKVEVLSTVPLVFAYRQVISDDEIAVIQKIANMSSSKIGDPSNWSLNSFVRESFTGWVYDEDHPVVKRVRNRVSAFTKLDMNFSEPLQVTSYGLGGHYIPHYDAIEVEKVFQSCCSSMLRLFSEGLQQHHFFSLSVPDHGGATVFPISGLTFTPSRNDALFWYNLHRDGKHDFATYHAGCPVISGSKWVANQWIRVIGQQFRRPCGLEMDIRPPHVEGNS